MLQVLWGTQRNITWPRAQKQGSKTMALLHQSCCVQWGHRGKGNGPCVGEGAFQVIKISVGRGGKIFPGRELHKQLLWGQ